MNAPRIDYVHEMSDKVLSMVRISIEALKKQDVALAKTITQTEREVDQMYLTLLNKLITEQQVNR